MELVGWFIKSKDLGRRGFYGGSLENSHSRITAPRALGQSNAIICK